ncbi:MAG: type II toxin-antitoxin system VapC family toxin [Spirochaetales bacterium]|jgi:predicted nucleic acid-binding protein|nr:type II toxin-antitoxin system VapC family toxin [Spirochaetales bacterium]
MNGTKIVFDTCAGIKLLDGKYDLASLGDDIDQAQQFTSVIVRMEMLAKPGITPDEERKIREFLADMVVAPLDNSVEKIAVEIRRTTTIKLPDCIVAATAIALDAILLTDDQGLKKLVWPGLKTLAI